MGVQGIHNIDRGTTYYGGRTIDSANLSGGHLLGQRKVFRNTKSRTKVGSESTAETDDQTALRNEKDVVGMLVRNESGVTLLPGRAVSWATRGKSVSGYVRLDYDEIAGVVDDQLPAAGVVDDDIFWLITEGEVLMVTPTAGSGFGADWAVGDVLAALTSAAANATTSNATNTGGRLQRWSGAWNVTSDVTNGYVTKLAINGYARCLSARTTAQTHTSVLVELKKF